MTATPEMDDTQTQLFDRRFARLARRRQDLSGSGFLHDKVNEDLIDRLADIRRRFDTGVYSGAQPPAARPANTFFHLHDLAAVRPAAVAEEEWWPFAQGALDLILSGLSLQNVNDLPGALIQMRRSLKPDGLFLAAMTGGETLHELRHCLAQAETEIKAGLSPRVHPFADKQQAGALLQRAGFALPVVDSEIVEVTYPDSFALMRDLRAMGGGNIIAARQKTNPGKALFRRADEIYKESFPAGPDRIKASFEIIYLIGWAPHDSQQKPKRPGSADASLAEALETKEIKTGDKARPV